MCDRDGWALASSPGWLAPGQWRPRWFIYAGRGRLISRQCRRPAPRIHHGIAGTPWDVDDTEGSTSVTTYTITITADDEAAATTRLRLETSGDQVILTDLHLHDGKGLSTGQLPAIDYGLLLRAITTTTATPLSSATAPTAPPAPTGPAATALARRRTRTAAAPKARRGGRGSASVPAAAAQPAAGGRTRRPTAGNKAAAAANKSVRAGRKTTEATAAKASGRTTGGTGRAYRRMPDDFAAVYQQAGSAAAVAEHYQVPRHTANGWIRRLRKQGTIPTNR